MDKKVEKELITIYQAINILGSGLKIKSMVMEFFNIKMEQFMMDNGLMINQRIKVRLFIPIRINMKVHF